jgi:hypothetical protein
MRPIVKRKQHPVRRYAASEILRHLWEAFPGEHDTLRGYVARAKAYRSECGCATGGAFTVAAIVGLLFYAFAYRGFRIEHWLADTVLALIGVVGAAVTGKLAGVGFARLRLALLGRELRRRYDVRGL